MCFRGCSAPPANWIKVQMPVAIYVSFMPLIIPCFHQRCLKACAWVLSRHVCLCQAVELGKKRPETREKKKRFKPEIISTLSLCGSG